MARSRRRKPDPGPAGAKVYRNAEEARRQVKELRRQGAEVVGTRAAKAAIGMVPTHRYTEEVTGGLPEPEAILLARQTGKAQPNPDDIYAPTATINPADPRTKAASYYSSTQTVVIEWGDGGVPYAYYGVPPQVWDEFVEADSPGRFINGVLNGYTYGPIGPRYRSGQRSTNW